MDMSKPPRLRDMGKHKFPVTANPQAQAYIDQGMNLAYAFNHFEARRAFRHAADLDGDCVMAFWGQALVLGPNINLDMLPEDESVAYEIMKLTLARKSKLSRREQDYINALATRYSGRPEDRQERNEAYTKAMWKVHKRYPDDLDAAVMYVEALMDERPWDYWLRDGSPRPRIAEAVQLLENVMARNPDHPGALHLYIHILEMTYPRKAEAAADRLRTLVPAAGHLLHMSSHIYMQTGRYNEAILSNKRAAAVDEAYIEQCGITNEYTTGYYPHNLHFLSVAAMFDGQGKLAIATARRVAMPGNDEMLKERPIMAAVRVVPYFALTRFGRWDEMLKEPSPLRESTYSYGVWQYARGLSFLAKGDLANAEKALAVIKKLLPEKALDESMFSHNPGRMLLTLGIESLSGEIAAKRKRFDVAIGHLQTAVRLEDSLSYAEPYEWHYPLRQALGAVLLSAGRPAEAETIYWEDLRLHPENGWSLFGLSQALRAQKNDDAQLIEKRYKKAWSHADVVLKASRINW